MPDSLTYDSYNFPSPLPAIAESDELIVFEGKYDHKANNIQAIGTITGDSLSGIHLQKMQMISGFLNEYQNLTVTLGTDTRVFSKCLVEGVDVPAVDLVLFSDKKRSRVDIVQAIGRCLRKSGTKKLALFINSLI